MGHKQASAQPAETRQHLDTHAAFFRQGTWLVLATGISGLFMLATQLAAARWMDKREYLVFFALLRLYLLLGIPAVGLQAYFAQQTAAAISDDQKRCLEEACRAVLRGILLLCPVLALLTWAVQDWVVRAMSITNPLAFWVAMSMGVLSLAAPVLRGVVQGRQHFLGLGWALIVDGIGRFSAVTTLVLLGGQAVGGMTGAMISLGAATALCAWIVRDISWLRGPTPTFHWGEWLKRVVPTAIGTGIVVLFTSADVVYVQSLFPDDAKQLYSPAAMIGLALTMYALPLAQVMFPKVARSAALRHKSMAMPLALAATASGGMIGAIVCTLFPELPLRLFFWTKPDFWAAAPLVPWFAWAVLPLTLANVLINTLIARGRFRVAPWLVGVAVLYLGSLLLLRSWFQSQDPLVAFRSLLALLGGCNTLLLVVAAWFSRQDPLPEG